MPAKQIPDTTISLNSRELELLRYLVDQEKEAVRTSLRATGRWTERLEQHVGLLADVVKKLRS